MSEMKTITINGKSYTVADPDAAKIDDPVVGQAAWSGKNIVDRLCPTFSESGAVVVCSPVAGYPLEVVSHLAAADTPYTSVKLTRCGKNLLSGDVLVLDKWVTEDTGNHRFELGELPEGTYTISISMRDDYEAGGFYYFTSRFTEDESYSQSNLNILAGAGQLLQGQATRDCTFTARRGEKFSLWCHRNKTFEFVKSVQLEAGQRKTPHEIFYGDTFTIDLGQTIYGGTYDWATGKLTDQDGHTYHLAPQQILALTGANTLYSDTGDTTVTGRGDLTAVIEKLINAMLAQGGNI